VLKPGFPFICLLVALVGCSTAARRVAESAATGWDPVEKTNAPAAEFEHVTDGPQLAPPPGNLPEPLKPAVNVARETWIPVARWARENHFGTLRETALSPVPAFALTTASGLLRFQIKSQLAQWNGLDLHLGFEPLLLGGEPFMHTLDLEKNIRPLLHPFPVPTKTNRVIVLDPGHGGKDVGTASILGHASEKDFTLDWARRLGHVLETNGWQVWLTRTSDVEVALSNRVAFAEEHHADLFISLHFNSIAPSLEQAGLETYCLTPTGMPSTIKRANQDDVSLVFPNNAFDEANYQLALGVHRALLKSVGESDRGVRRARFLAVLRGQNRPAILIEGGYLSNPREARRIADPAFRQRLADAVAAVLKIKGEDGGLKVEDGKTVPRGINGN
jgi:N-acetylmuramoyl-L-alanine amidase